MGRHPRPPLRSWRTKSSAPVREIYQALERLSFRQPRGTTGIPSRILIQLSEDSLPASTASSGNGMTATSNLAIRRGSSRIRNLALHHHIRQRRQRRTESDSTLPIRAELPLRMADRSLPDRFHVEPEVERSGIADRGFAGPPFERIAGIVLGLTAFLTTSDLSRTAG